MPNLATALRKPFPSLRATSHMLTVTVPGFDESIDVSVTAKGTVDQIEIISVDDVSVGPVSLLPDEVWIRNPISLCSGTVKDFLSLRDWLHMAIVHSDDKLDQISEERDGCE